MLPADPDVVLVIHEDPVLAQRPVVAGARTAPRVQQVAIDVELEHGRRGGAAERARRGQGGAPLVLGQRARTLDDPDLVMAGHPPPPPPTPYPGVPPRRWAPP